MHIKIDTIIGYNSFNKVEPTVCIPSRFFYLQQLLVLKNRVGRGRHNQNIRISESCTGCSRARKLNKPTHFSRCPVPSIVHCGLISNSAYRYNIHHIILLHPEQRTF